MPEHKREFEVEYYDISMRDGMYDVSFELTEGAEDLLFRAMEEEVSDHIRDGNFPEQKMHLFKRLSNQSKSHPPWVDVESEVRAYDLVITEWEYHLLSKMVGNVMSDILAPEAADDHESLQDAWRDITQQMQEAGEGDDPVYRGSKDSIQVVGQVDLDDGSRFNIYHDTDADEEWYICTDCGTSYSEIGETHVCKFN